MVVQGCRLQTGRQPGRTLKGVMAIQHGRVCSKERRHRPPGSPLVDPGHERSPCWAGAPSTSARCCWSFRRLGRKLAVDSTSRQRGIHQGPCDWRGRDVPFRRLHERKVACEDFLEERFLRRLGDRAERFLLGLVLYQCVTLLKADSVRQLGLPKEAKGGASCTLRRLDPSWQLCQAKPDSLPPSRQARRSVASS